MSKDEESGSGTLPGMVATGGVAGFAIKMRAIMATDELNAAQDVDEYETETEQAVVSAWALWKRAIIEINGEPFDQMIGLEEFRNKFTQPQLRYIRLLYEALHGVSKEEEDAFSKSITVSTA